MRFFADLHVHSKYSRATSRDLDLEHLAAWAARKGIGVVATGDFVHPAWNAELKQKLVAAEPGLFRLAPDIEAAVARTLPAACRTAVRFMLAVEISTIYKKAGRTRKIHHLIYAPDFATVDRIAARLARVGNIASDGRPILGLDSRDLLEIALEAGEGAYLVPAHIWTPWFAALGSQSGFDSIAECYGDLADHVFAVETGLSSDPAMNWRVSFLDRYRLTSSSDAHSPGKLGREATQFDCTPDYFAIRRALETGEGYVGTVEFFPEEGKYHLDGHRKCGVRLSPRETLAVGGRCPACSGPVTIGVAHRVEMLADRAEAGLTPPPTAGEVASLVALPAILSEVAGTGPASKAVSAGYERLLAGLGPELPLLQSLPLDAIARKGSPLLAEAIARLRAGRVIRDAGYDGEYGVIRLFDAAELETRTRGALLFDAGVTVRAAAPVFAPALADVVSDRPEDPGPEPIRLPSASPAPAVGLLDGLDADQRAAAAIVEGPLCIVAGPGSGKTRTLTHRLAHLVAEAGVSAPACLAITFTRRAAAELRERLAALTPACAGIAVHTFHSLGLAILREHATAAGLAPGFRIAAEAERAALMAATLGISPTKAEGLMRTLSKLKRTRGPAIGDLAAASAAYAAALAGRNWIDFDDLVHLSADLLAADPALAAGYRARFRFIAVDELQDVDAGQYRLLTLLAGRDGNLCVIGDPDQAIYGFRGADAACFARFAEDYPGAASAHLRRNYRSTGTIVTASAQVVAPAGERAMAAMVRGMHERIAVHAAPSEAAEAEFVVATIERLIGGHTFLSIDSGRAAGNRRTDLGFADFAVLYRTEAQSAALCEALARAGMPVKTSAHAPIADKPAVRALLQALEGAGPQRPPAAAIEAAAARVSAEGGLDAAAVAQAAHWLKALALPAAGEQAGFFEAAALATEADFFDPRADRVSLLTMHAAKGLEFAVVFVIGVEDGIVPLHWGARDPATAAEERRLFYVAMTRAKDRLYLSRAVQRHWRGCMRQLAASPFLADIEAQLRRDHPVDLPPRRAESRQLTLF